MLAVGLTYTVSARLVRDQLSDQSGRELRTATNIVLCPPHALHILTHMHAHAHSHIITVMSVSTQLVAQALILLLQPLALICGKSQSLVVSGSHPPPQAEVAAETGSVCPHTVRVRFLPAKAGEKSKEKRSALAAWTDFHKINMIVYNNVPNITSLPN